MLASFAGSYGLSVQTACSHKARHYYNNSMALAGEGCVPGQGDIDRVQVIAGGDQRRNVRGSEVYQQQTAVTGCWNIAMSWCCGVPTITTPKIAECMQNCRMLSLLSATSESRSVLIQCAIGKPPIFARAAPHMGSVDASCRCAGDRPCRWLANIDESLARKGNLCFLLIGRERQHAEWAAGDLWELTRESSSWRLFNKT